MKKMRKKKRSLPWGVPYGCPLRADKSRQNMLTGQDWCGWGLWRDRVRKAAAERQRAGSEGLEGYLP